MANATKPGPSMQAMLDKALSPLRKEIAMLKKVCGPSSGSTLSSHSPSLAGQRQARRQQGARRQFLQEAIHAPQGTPLHRLHCGVSSSPGADGFEEEGRSQSPWEATLQADQQQEGQGKGEGARLKGFRYGYPNTLPDWLLTVPTPTAINIIILNTPINIVEAAQFKNYVHCSPGVYLPPAISKNLSIGMRYMSYQPMHSELIQQAYNDFERRLRWRLKFAFEKKRFIFL